MSSFLLFDFDGTLIDSAPGILRSFDLVLQQQGIEPKVALGTHLIGPPLPQTMATLTGESDPQRLAVLIDAFKAAYDTEGYKATVPYADLSAVLTELGADHRLVLLTNKRRFPTLRILEWFGLEPLFQAVFTPDTWSPALSSKADTMARALDALQTDAAACVMIGDSRDDAHAAAENRMPFVAVTFGYGDAATQELYPVHAAVDSLAQLPSALRRRPWSAGI